MSDAPDDRRYFEARIEQELSLAREARHPQAAKSHATLATLYLQRLGSFSEPARGEGV